MIQIIVNGQSHSFPVSRPAELENQGSGETMNLTQLVERMGWQDKRIAVERNGEIVPRSKFGQTFLSEGDRLEIVVAVGGG